MKKRVIDFTKHKGYGVTLTQTGLDVFSVSYGLQVDKGLNYGDAAAKLGEALMHAAACEGQLETGCLV